MFQKFSLISIRWEILTLPACWQSVIIVDIVLAPVSETNLNESDSRVVVILGSEVGVELLCEPLQLIVGPIRIICQPVTLHCLAVLWTIAIATVLNIQRNSCGASQITCTIIRCACYLTVAARIFISETHDSLVTTACHIIKECLKRAPVILQFIAHFSRHHLAWQAV